MKAVLMVCTLTLLIFCAGSSAFAEIVTIDAVLLPGSPQASYAHCWAAAGSSGNNIVPFPGGRKDLTGADITCDAPITSGGNSANAHSRARVTGGVLLEATVNATKVTFAAAAAYAQGGGQTKKSGVNKSSLGLVKISGLQVTGHQDPIDDELWLEVTNLKPNQINQTMIEEVVRDRELRAQILENVGQSGFQLTPFSGEPYLKIQARITAENKFAVTASAPLLCDPQKLKEEGVDVRKLSSPGFKDQEAVERVLAKYEKFCSRQDNVVQTSSFDVKSNKDEKGADIHKADQSKKLEYVIVIPENTTNDSVGNDFSVNTIQFTSSRRDRTTSP